MEQIHSTTRICTGKFHRVFISQSYSQEIFWITVLCIKKIERLAIKKGEEVSSRSTQKKQY